MTNNNKKGNKNKNQAIFFLPSLHIKFKIHVQNNTYKNLNKNTNIVLVTTQE